MTRESATPFALFSAFTTTQSKETNEARTQFLARQLNALGVDWSNVTGSYKGAEEVSFLALLPGGDGSDEFWRILKLLKAYEQESLLYVDGQRCATLVYADGHSVKVGRFFAVPEPIALAGDGWTRDLAGTYYAVG